MTDLGVGGISERLAGNAEGVCRELLPNGRREGAEWRVGNINGDPGKSLAVHLVGPKAGIWRDFADGETGGDLLDLIEAVKRLDKAGAVQWAKSWLGLNDSRSQREPANAKHEWTPILPVPPDAPNRLPQHRLGTPTAKWAYRDANGQLLFIVCRFDRDGGKDFAPLTFCQGPRGQSEWRCQALSPPRPLYGLDRLDQHPDAPVLICEGEKAADAAQQHFPEHVAVTWPGGTNAVAKADWGPLRGRSATAWPDADEPGRKAAQDVASACHAVGAKDVRMVALPADTPEKWDLADELPAGWAPETLQHLIAEAKPVEPVEPPAVDGDDALADAKAVVLDLAARAKTDKGAPFEPDSLTALSVIRLHDPAHFQRLRDDLKQAGVAMRDFNREVRKNSYSVIQGGALGGDSATERIGPYKVINGAICLVKLTLEGPVTVPLCNFNARITGEEIRDDGAEQLTVFSIEGTLQGGKPLPVSDVPGDRYASMNWVTTNWGTAPVIYAGMGAKDHLRVAVQLFSLPVPRRTVFTHLGWRKIGGEWFYLHGAGAIGPNGPVDDVQVRTSDSRLTCYALPEPPSGDELKAAIRASLSVLNLAPAKVTYPLMAAVYRAPTGEMAGLDMSMFVAGPTGAQKSAVTALGQNHFGAEFHGENLPGNWSSTPNSREKQAFLVKDAIFTVDDFSPSGTTSDVQRLHRDADRLFRAQGNRAGRGRMRPDGSMRPEYFPRGITVSSGEDIPRGQSLRARIVILELSRFEVDLALLTRAQYEASEGRFAQAMAGYVQWLAPQIETLKAEMPERLRGLRAKAREHHVFHDRTPDIVASLAVGWAAFLRFALDSGGITAEERVALWDQCWETLLEVAEAQAGYQADEEPAARFLALLGSAVATGQAHIVDATTNGKPENPEAWGWRKRTVLVGADEREEWQPKGNHVGWIDGEDVFLDPDAAFAAAQRLASAQGGSLAISPQTLWKRMFERSKLASRDEARRRNTTRRVIGGSRRNIIHILAGTLCSRSGPTGPTGPRPNDTNGLGAEIMGHFSDDPEKAAHETGPQAVGNATDGPDGPNGPEIEHNPPSSDEIISDGAVADFEGGEI